MEEDLDKDRELVLDFGEDGVIEEVYNQLVYYRSLNIIARGIYKGYTVSNENLEQLKTEINTIKESLLKHKDILEGQRKTPVQLRYFISRAKSGIDDDLKEEFEYSVYNKLIKDYKHFHTSLLLACCIIILLNECTDEDMLIRQIDEIMFNFNFDSNSNTFKSFIMRYVNDKELLSRTIIQHIEPCIDVTENGIKVLQKEK